MVGREGSVARGGTRDLGRWRCGRGGGLGSSTIFKKFNEPYAPS